MSGLRNDDRVHAGRAPALRLAAVLLLGGSLHFLAPRFFDRIIPRRLPGRPRAYTRAFGAAALGIGTGLSIARTRRRSAVLAGAFFIAVMPAKVRLAVSWWRDGTKRLPARITGVVQLFWQVPLLTEAWRVWRNAPN
ncbi:membrane protein [Salinifilum aidingensis]